MTPFSAAKLYVAGKKRAYHLHPLADEELAWEIYPRSLSQRQQYADAIHRSRPHPTETKVLLPIQIYSAQEFWLMSVKSVDVTMDISKILSEST